MTNKNSGLLVAIAILSFLCGLYCTANAVILLKSDRYASMAGIYGFLAGFLIVGSIMLLRNLVKNENDKT